MSQAIKIIVAVNVALFLVDWIDTADVIRRVLGLTPADMLERARLWQPFTYMFVHGGLFHILFNMLALWMFGTELERMWGTRAFTKFYFVAGLGAAATTLGLSMVPGGIGDLLYATTTIGASGAVYGVLLAYGMYFPHRLIYFMGLFPIPARYFVMIIGAISLLMTTGPGNDGVAHAAHLGGLIAGYIYLKGGRLHLMSELQYRYLKWRINRQRRKFDVYSGGRADDVNRRVH